MEHLIVQIVILVIHPLIVALDPESCHQQQPGQVPHIKVHLQLTGAQVALTEVPAAHQVVAIEVPVAQQVVAPEVQVVAQGVFPEAAHQEAQVAHPEAQEEEVVQDLVAEEDRPNLILL